MAVSSTPRKLNKKNEVKTLPFYFESLQSVKKVCEFMSDYLDTDGYYLLRQSISRPGNYTISVTHGRGIKHICVETEEGFYHFSVEKFATLQALVDFYRMHPVPNIEGVADVYLRMPITSATPRSRSRPSVANNPAVCTSSRPPMPLPKVAPEPRVYSEAINEDYDMSRRLIERLKSAEERCECGLTVDESELPDGWSVHLSKEHRRIFFTAPDAQTTTWNLPVDISIKLTPEQQGNLQRFMAELKR